LNSLGITKYDHKDWGYLLEAHKEVYNVLLLTGNVFGSIPLRHTTNLKVKYQKCIEMLVSEKDRVRSTANTTGCFVLT